MNKPGIKRDTPRLNFNREKAMVYKEKLGFTLGQLSQLMNLRATNYFGARGTMKAITVERAETLAKAFNCKVEDFTEGTYLDKRQRHEWQRERIKRMRKADKERMKEARKTVSAKPWEEVLGQMNERDAGPAVKAENKALQGIATERQKIQKLADGGLISEEQIKKLNIVFGAYQKSQLAEAAKAWRDELGKWGEEYGKDVGTAYANLS